MRGFYGRGTSDNPPPKDDDILGFTVKMALTPHHLYRRVFLRPMDAQKAARGRSPLTDANEFMLVIDGPRAGTATALAVSGRDRAGGV